MRSKITFVLVLALVIGILGFVACSQDKPAKVSDNPLVGTWKSEYEHATLNTINFAEDGKGTALQVFYEVSGEDLVPKEKTKVDIEWKFESDGRLYIGVLKENRMDTGSTADFKWVTEGSEFTWGGDRPKTYKRK
jgi:hypothetical protein